METAEDSVSEPEVVIEPALEEILALPVEPIAVELTQPTAEPIPEIEAEEPEVSAEACVESESEIEAIEEIEAVEEVEEIEEIVPEVVEYVDAEIADTLMSDRLAMKIANVTKGAGKGKLAIINIGDIDSAFEANAVVDIDALKECGLISKKAGRLKILADGTMNKPLTVKAESYSVQAIKMIELTGGEVVILKD